MAVSLLSLSCATPVTKGRALRQAAPTPIPAPTGVGADGELLSLETVDGSGTAFITDFNGFVVYGVQGETAEELICIDDCLTEWMPVQPRDKAIAAELDLDLYSTFTRPDGTEQVSYMDVPLYTWSGDNSVGLAQGTGVAGIWFAITSDGDFIK